MTGFYWAVCAAAAISVFAWGAYCAGKKSERARRLREEINAYEKMDKIRARVDVLPVGVLLSVLRARPGNTFRGGVHRPLRNGRSRP